MSKTQQFLSGLKTHQEEQLEQQHQSQQQLNDSDESDQEDHNEILNKIVWCQQNSKTDKIFEFDLGNQIHLNNFDMNKSALYLDALAWLYCQRVDRTLDESFKLKCDLLRVYDTSSTKMDSKKKTTTKRFAAQDISKVLQMKDIIHYGEQTLDYKPYTHQYDTLQINPFFNQTSKSLDLQDLSTLIMYNPQFNQDLEIIIDPDQLLEAEDNKRVFTGFIKLELDTTVIDYSLLVANEYKIDFSLIEDFRDRCKFLLKKQMQEVVKLEKSQQQQIDSFVNKNKIKNDKLQQAQEVIDQKKQIVEQLSNQDKQLEQLNLQYQKQLQINIEDSNNVKVQLDELNWQIQQINLEDNIQENNILTDEQISLMLEQKKKQQQHNQIENIQQQQFDEEEFNYQLPQIEQEQDEQQINNGQIDEQQRQEFDLILQQQQEQKKLLQEQFSEQQKKQEFEIKQIQEQKKQKEFLEKSIYQDQLLINQQKIQLQQPIEQLEQFNEMNYSNDEMDLGFEEELDNELPAYDQQVQQQQKGIQTQSKEQQQQQQQQQPTNHKKKVKKIYPDSFDFNDANTLNRKEILKSLHNEKRDFTSRELVLKCLADNGLQFDYFRFFEYLTREYENLPEEDEPIQQSNAEPESLIPEQIEYEEIPDEKLSQIAEQYRDELDYYLVPFKVTVSEKKEPTTIKQLQLILERVIESIQGNLIFSKLLNTMPMILPEKISKSKLFAAILFVSKNRGYTLQQHSNKDFKIIKAITAIEIENIEE